MTVQDSQLHYLPTFDWLSWRPNGARLLSALAMLAFAVSLLVRNRTGDVPLACLVLVETSLLLLPWRLPRIRRSNVSFCVEIAVGLITPVGAMVTTLVTRPDWLTSVGNPLWYLAALGLLAVLIRAEGIDLRSVLNGDLSFIAGTTPAWFRRARSTTIVAGPVGEEFAFRGPVLTGADPAVAILAAAAFVARHHVQPGRNGSGTPRARVVEVLGAVGFLVLTWSAGALYPALVAHLLYNMPGLVVELRRDTVAR
jgi:membrane protease YdiL (CAAX protease family)